MEGSPYRKFSISRRKGSDPETEPEKLHSGEPGFLLVGILGTGVPSSGDPEAVSCLGSGGIRYLISPASDRDLMLFRPLILVEDGELWASDDVLEMMEPGALMFPEEGLA
ncbi:hypothetical protein DY000_02040275 [Brassica cretica]|uniref:Uncharacterized protein n=1 Tax=Brassica cretica TaxID=69181 RepID=A0ABQ7B6U1_BRACR|nr:hypothetical protein DY000_02040275 [Brassica cretica]